MQDQSLSFRRDWSLEGNAVTSTHGLGGKDGDHKYLLPYIDNGARVKVICTNRKKTRFVDIEHSPRNLKEAGITQSTTGSGLCEYCHMKHVI